MATTIFRIGNTQNSSLKNLYFHFSSKEMFENKIDVQKVLV